MSRFNGLLVSTIVFVGGFEVACADDSRALAFEPAGGSPIPVGPMAGRPVVGDVDGDTHPDIVIACGACCGDRPDPTSGHLVVLLGNGKGGFAQASTSPMKIVPSVRKVALGDVDGDGKLDAVTAEHDSYAVNVLLGDGKGGFTAAAGSPVKTATGTRPHTHEIVLGDTDGEGSLDVLTTNVFDDSVSVLLGDGRARFVPSIASPVEVGGGPYDSIALADVDGDGVLDLVTPNIGRSTIGVMRGDKNGGFLRFPGSPYSVAKRPGYVIAADVNGDAKPDLLATHDDVGLLTVLVNDGHGGFLQREGSPFALAAPAWSLDAADLDGDKDVDMLAGVARGSPLVLLGNGDGTFEDAKLELPAGDQPSYAALADLNHDARLDIVTGNYGSGDVSVLLARPR